MVKLSKQTVRNKWDFLSIGAGTKNPLIGGLCLKSQPSALRLNQSPDMLNLNTDDRGTYSKRPGQMELFNLGSGGINGIYENYKGYRIIAHGTKLYKQQGTSTPVQIVGSLTNAKMSFFQYNGILYMKNGYEYLQYDGSTLSNVTGYSPITSYLRKPDGTQGTELEPINLLWPGFRNQFNGDAVTKGYYLDRKGLDATTITAKVDGVIMTEGSGFAVDRVNGYINFVTAPSNAGDLNKNNVEITAYKTITGNAERILGCTLVKEFGGVTVHSGNPNYPNIWYFTEIPNAITPTAQKPDYFPESRQYSFGSDVIKQFVVQYDKLIILRENSLLTISKGTDPDGNLEYPISLLNDTTGCIASDSVQLINNTPVFLSKTGVQLIYSTLVAGEKNIINISENINGVYPDRLGLLQESNLSNAVSYDDGSKYWLALNGYAYILDYDVTFDYTNPEKLCWYKYSNIDASHFHDGGYCGKTTGSFVQWITAKNDFGQPIKAYWYSKLIDFDSANFYKTVTDLWITTRSNANSSLTINLFDGNGVKVKTLTLPKSKTKSYSWSNFSWDNFSWSVQRYGKPLHVSYNLNDIVYFQIQLENSVLNEDLSIIEMLLKYQITRMVR